MIAPLLLSTWSFGQRGNDAAWPALERGGTSLDAVEKVCQVVEADPAVDSVGFGGLPDSAGQVSLDGCIMLSPSRCGSVCAVRRYMHPVSVARRVMECTSHFMLAGPGAEAFAEAQGFLPADLLSADAQDAFTKWQKDRDLDSRLAPPRPIDLGGRGGGKLFFHPAPEGFDESRWKHHDTIGVLAIDVHGTLAGACSTSGTPFKLPGRVGDSPIIGHGLYVDPQHGGAVATGSGELIMGACATFLAVDLMRRGATALDAACVALRRILEHFELQPHHQAAMIALRPDGTFATAALRTGYKTSVRNKQRSEVIDAEAVLVGS